MVKCDCSAEALEIEYDKEENKFYFSFWQQGYRFRLSWKERIRWCFRIIASGNPWTDSIIVGAVNARTIRNFLTKFIKNNL